ncbi:MAG: regulatory protein RecX [Gaiellaceae bacterium]
MPIVTGLHRARRGWVAVELDGRPWRELPVAAVAAAGLYESCDLDRDRTRRLAQARRRAEALELAAGALRRRPLSGAELDDRLTVRGVQEPERRATRDTLERAGYVDDARLAEDRAAWLAERGNGNALIRDDLERRGVDSEVIEASLGRLEPEPERVARIVERRGDGARTARYLAARGFDEEVVRESVSPDVASDP